MGQIGKKRKNSSFLQKVIYKMQKITWGREGEGQGEERGHHHSVTIMAKTDTGQDQLSR